MKALGRPEEIIDPPPYMKSVDALLRFRPVIFGIICALAIAYGLYGIATGTVLFDAVASNKSN